MHVYSLHILRAAFTECYTAGRVFKFVRFVFYFVHSHRRPCVRVSSVTLVHPAKAGGRNEMPFGRDTTLSQVTLY